MLLEVAKTGEIAPGGMKFVRAGEREIVVCNCDGRYYAVDRRCGHMNGPLEMGALDGTIVTCPMHHVQFDVDERPGIESTRSGTHRRAASGRMGALHGVLRDADAAYERVQHQDLPRQGRSGGNPGRNRLSHTDSWVRSVPEFDQRS